MSLERSEAEQEYRDKLKQLIATLEEGREALQQHGIDVTPQLEELRGQLKKFEDACAAEEKAMEELLQAQANLADAKFEAFKDFSCLLDQLMARYPNNPNVKKWLEERDELQKRFPRF